MSEPSTEATAEQPEQEAPATGTDTAEQPKPDTAPKPTETVEHWKAMAREQERRAKANAEAAKRLQEIEDRDLSELQKATRDRDALAEQLAQSQREATRTRVALAKGLPSEIAETLNGSTEEELAAHADRLLAWRGNVPPATPRPDPGQGARPTSPTAEADAEYERFFPSSKRA